MEGLLFIEETVPPFTTFTIYPNPAKDIITIELSKSVNNIIGSISTLRNDWSRIDPTTDSNKRINHLKNTWTLFDGPINYLLNREGVILVIDVDFDQLNEKIY